MAYRPPLEPALSSRRTRSCRASRGCSTVPAGPVAIVQDDRGRNQTLEQNAVTAAFFDFSSKEEIDLTPNPDGLVFVHERGKYPVILDPNKEFTGKQVTSLAPTQELLALVAYVQKLGMNRGKWRDIFEPQLCPPPNVELPRSQEAIALRQGGLRRGAASAAMAPKGDGNGSAATFLTVRPRNFTTGTFKFRSTPSGSLPTDGDLLRTITDGVRGTAMPTWHELPEKDRLAVLQYVKYVLAVDRSDPKQPYAFFSEEQPQASGRDRRAAAADPGAAGQGQGALAGGQVRAVPRRTGEGNGQSAIGLKDDWGFPIRPANLTTGLFKSGPSVKDIFRTISTGPQRHADAVLRDHAAERRRPLGARLLHRLAVGLQGPADRGAAADVRGGPAGAGRSRDRGQDLGHRYVPLAERTYANGDRTAPEDGAAFAGGAWARRSGVDVLPERPVAAGVHR